MKMLIVITVLVLAGFLQVSTASKVRLSRENNSTYVTSGSRGLASNYKYAEVIPDPDDTRQSVYAVYTGYNFNKDSSTTGKVLILSEADGKVKLEPHILSLQGWHTSVGYVTFNLKNFRGDGSAHWGSRRDRQFPQDASSIYINSGVYNFYTETNFNGDKVFVSGKKDIGPGAYGCLQAPAKSGEKL